MPELRLNLLGKPEVWLGDAPFSGFSTVKSEALLYYLAVTGRAHTRDALASLFWGDMPEANAKRNLTKALSDLRKELDPFLLVEPRTISLNYEASITLDITQFETAQDLTAAIGLYRGDLLEGVYIKDAPGFEEWMVVERERLRERMLVALEEVTNQLAAQGEYVGGVKYARRLLELDPWRETAHRQLMVLLARRGQYTAAITQYDKCRQILLDELGVEPMPETTGLYERILAARSIQIPPLPAETEPFIGRTAERARLHEMLSNPECRLITVIGLGGMGKTRLALAMAREINREGALRFVNGVVFVPLAHVSSPAVPLALAEALAISLSEPGQAVLALVNYLKNKEILLILDNFEHLLDETVFLTRILNTCPYVKFLITSREPMQLAAEWQLDLEGLTYPIDAGAWKIENDQGYDAIKMFVQAAQQVQADYELTDTDTPHLLHLCQLVGGMPLALKLAASWVPVIPIYEIVVEVKNCMDVLAAKMRDLPARQRSIRAVFDSTWQQLSQEEQNVFQALSIFRGGFTREAASMVAGANLLILAKLIEKSLVQQAEKDRFGMHELVRQFGSEKLAENEKEEKACQKRRSAYYLAFLKNREEVLVGKDQQTALDEIGDEIENIRAGWKWAVMEKDVDAILPVIDVFYNFHQIRSRFQEGEELFGGTVKTWRSNSLQSDPNLAGVHARLSARWGAFCIELQDYRTANQCLQSALKFSEAPNERAFVLYMIGRLNIDQGDRLTGENYLNESYKISQDAEDLAGMAKALSGLGQAAAHFGDFLRAKEATGQSLILSRRLGRPDWIARTLGTLAWTESCLGNYLEAETLWKEGLTIHQQLVDPLGIAVNLNFLGWVTWCSGGSKVPDAVSFYEQALTTYKTRGYREQMAMCQGDLALALLDLGEPNRALQYAQEAYTICRELGSIHFQVYTSYVLGAAVLENGNLAASRNYLEEALWKAWKTQKADNFMSALFFYAQLLLKESELDSAGEEQKHPQVFECLSTVVHHQATWQVIRERAKSLLPMLTDQLPDENTRNLPESLKDWNEWAATFVKDFKISIIPFK